MVGPVSFSQKKNRLLYSRTMGHFLTTLKFRSRNSEDEKKINVEFLEKCLEAAHQTIMEKLGDEEWSGGFCYGHLPHKL